VTALRRSPDISSSVGAARFSSATLHEAAGRTGALPAQIKPVHGSFRVSGPAYPVRCAPGDNLWLHRAIYAAAPLDVLVVDVGDGREFGYWGEILSCAAVCRGLGGLVINGCVRDGDRLLDIGFPVFAAGLCIQGTVKDPASDGTLAQPVALGPVTVHERDLVVGDGDGVVVLPAADASRILAAASQRDREELEMMRRLRQGETTIDLLGLRDTDAVPPRRQE
jgi:4-hydroxy-4-methyl-2-oxoglutarate aldolase